ncbi:MAG: type II toxin-antitoxin system HipA family toxin [Planctomycetota bacterium]|nr:type II toxin-antitoxin system HipA family toxin [Planctomycetota bacterium]
MSTCEVRLWGRAIGAASWRAEAQLADFAYAEDFVGSGIELSPLWLPLGAEVRRFPELARTSFHGLPGLLADSLPDRFGNRLLDEWLGARGREPASLDPIERLCYTGTRCMGALEFHPATEREAATDQALELASLVELAGEVLGDRAAFRARLAGDPDQHAIASLLAVGTSAGGARAKAVVAWNPATGELRSGQVDQPGDFEPWLIKFDGVDGNGDKELGDPDGYGLVEYAYHLLALRAGIQMEPCRVLSEGGRHHFMTRRFDRFVGQHPRTGKARYERLHMASLGGLAHVDFNQAGAFSYEGALDVAVRLGLDVAQREELVRRAIFNVLARNQDDHVKNIAFLMDKSGTWRLSPAFDLTFAFNPSGAWTKVHQMSLNAKRDGFEASDFAALAGHAGLGRGRWRGLFDEVRSALEAWPELAEEARVPGAWAAEIGRLHRRL